MVQLLFLALTTALAVAQQQSFEVASIKVNQSGDAIMLYQPRPGGRFTATNSSLSLLIQYAYSVKQFQISGAPGWVQSDRYDISATAGGNQPGLDIRTMVRQLLEDRFHLQYHWETKEAPVYSLVVSKPGKLRESEPGDCSSGPPDVPCGALRNSPGHTFGRRLTANDLAISLSSFVGRPVLDGTSLIGWYDIDLQWTPEPARLQSSSPTAEVPSLSELTGPSVFTALQEQLGLKLASARGPVKTLVVDHVERPSED